MAAPKLKTYRAIRDLVLPAGQTVCAGADVDLPSDRLTEVWLASGKIAEPPKKSTSKEASA